MAEVTVDLPVTTARIVYDDGTPDAFVSTLADEDETGEIVLVVAGGVAHIYPINWDGGPDVTVVLPDPPSGYTLTDARYAVKAYREADTGGGDTSDFGLNPNPDDAPYLRAATSSHFVIDHLPIGGYDGVVVGRSSEDLGLLATGDTGNFGGDAWATGNIESTTDGVIHVAYMALRLVYTSDDFTPCDTWVDLDLSTATFDNPSGDQFGQYVDGIITGLDGHYAQYWFPFELDPVKRYRVRITFDPSSPDDAGGRWVLLYAALPGDEGGAYAHAQIGDGFSNTADEVTLTIGPTLGNWDDPDTGVPQGYTRLSFRSSEDGAVSAISIRKVCTTGQPWQRLTNRNFGLTSVGYYRQNSSRLTGAL